jgi:hypothetical protein
MKYKNTNWFIGILLALILISWEISAEITAIKPQDNIWQTLFKVGWVKKYSPELKSKIDFPKFSPEVKALDGKTITISGYVLPTDLYEGDFVVLSAYPMAQCFFCGGAGPESVMEVYPRNNRRSFATERVTFKGILELNESDYSHLIYKLKDAVVYFEEEK